jgi:GDP-4-dehydro-6-deoxy-D-mannose reductase
LRSLITGVGGFVGQYLAAWLLARDEAVSGIARHAVQWHVNAVASATAFELFEVDLVDRDAVTRALGAAAPDRVYHLAAQSSVAESFKDPIGFVHENATSLVNVLDALRAVAPQARILVVSSSEVYGRAIGGGPIDESAELRPENPYAVSKAANDLFAHQYHAAYSLDVVRVRPFTHIGAGQSDRFAVSSFARQIAEIESGLRPPVIEVGNLEAKRDVTDVRDMVRAYELAVLNGESGGVYNIGRGAAVSIRALLEELLNLSQVHIDVQVDPGRLRQVDAPMQVCDARRFRERTGWEARIPLTETLEGILAYWRAQVTPPHS